MRRNVKVKTAATRLLLRKAATSATPAARRAFPAWIDATDGASFPATAVTPRVRMALVLRTVSLKKSTNPRSVPHGPGAR